MRQLPIVFLLAAAGCQTYSKDAPEASHESATPPAVATPSPVPPTPDSPAIESTTFTPDLKVDLAALTKTATGLFYRDLTVGTGPVAAKGQTVSVHYAGWLADGTLFDQSGPNDPPYTFLLGAGRVIAGWDEGVAGMQVGGKRQLIIPPTLGYGAGGRGQIPPNAILVFTVDMVGVR